ncbi:CDP-glycerol glycerophosphotransferase family protein [Staphylococcus simiae]|uniref:CDP-glycerol glycerophosphotransferase family protein n=1 Tax=Staphylococcus simiae TaxID=308354 RepID=UPI001A96AC2B|nr:CDP-glycerol glycerophosphotransferase family protein [Staphylococcus simiae]MBO1198420.1 CDP-glycerol glycerophosphotransferase family protein [Staphylococcus simiae]MBO1200614.1 CDP-glycerol glycerophosphotransferase family protein [Staphylococcus simiae]MBO1202885.1 CDP-glycerol glycerophosphotransferase family protein [Staphylococcus simiae]MBO1210411.1 CDP-glycerol glycerophosphotransferase family protein [Staphylococcus simiae]MBO1228951.1 CDP-glycerol glycerophosphotransferase family
MRNRKLWIFNATNEFAGNPKWLFIYINKFRKDIEAYWMCNDINIVNKVRKLGFKAETYHSNKAEKLKSEAGVFVVHQVKEHIPVKFKNEVVILNLWHGVGIKPIERFVDSPGIRQRIYKKYIKYNEIYRNNQLCLVTSPLMERHFCKMFNLSEDQVVRSGYPANMFDKQMFSSFDHDIRQQKGLNTDTKIALYAPTFRDYDMTNFFGQAIPNMPELLTTLKNNNILLIIKMHYLVKKDINYLAYKKLYGNHPNILFWDNDKDIYEIFDQINIGIVDYSSIYYDLLASGVQHFIRYIYDYDKYTANRTLVHDYQEMTSGTIASNFDDLLAMLSHIESLPFDEQKNETILQQFWQYDLDTDNGFEKIIEATLNYQIKTLQLPKLYSFDIFDTIIQRKTLKPEGIFLYVKDKLITLKADLPAYVIHNYPRVRSQAESYMRDYYKKSEFVRDDKRLEIKFQDIIARIQSVYDLTSEQAQLLYDLEIEAELNNVEAKEDKLALLYDLLDHNQDVILISDMYLPKDVIIQMLTKVDPKLAELPLYVSSDKGNQKSTSLLYLDVFEDLNYDYAEWIHYGDNKHADFTVPKKLNIKPKHHKLTKFNAYENAILKRNKQYDTFLLTTQLARFRQKDYDNLNYYVYGYISSYFVPYVSWSIKKALKENIQTLYFISRDGELLKKIADAIIAVKGYDIQTKYIYGSRKAWRIPSFIDHIDQEFFSVFGNLAGLTNFDSAIKALHISEQEFEQVFPQLQHLNKVSKLTNNDRELIRITAQYNKAYHKLLLDKARQERDIVNDYLRQEIDFNEKFAFVEYWGRGYTQDCLDRLLNNISEQPIDTIFFYARSIYPTIGTAVRYNYTSKMTSLIFIESIFANIPYQSVPGYRRNNDMVEPIIQPKNYDKDLYQAMDNILPEFITSFYSKHYINEDELKRNFYDFGVDYFRTQPEDDRIVKYFAPLKDSVVLFEPEVEYAPAISYKMASQKLLGKKVQLKTKNKRMSLKRSPQGIQLAYKLYMKYVKKRQGKVVKRLRKHKVIKKVKKLIKYVK